MKFADFWVVIFLLCGCSSLHGDPPRAPDFDEASREATGSLQRYLRIDTTNPPGNEHRAAEFFKEIFDREGIENEIFDQGNHRANILARLPGSGAKRPILLLHHMDVVPAEAARWQVAPFSGAVRDGFIWGRGVTDMKGTAICHLMTMLLMKRAGQKLDRDVLFLGTADEEDGSANGVAWMVTHHPKELAGVEFVLTEGENIVRQGERTLSWNVAVTEKPNLWLRIVAGGKTGHASIPDKDGAVPKLIRALGKILAYEPEVRLLPAVDTYFREMSRITPGVMGTALADPAAALADARLRSLLLGDVNYAAYLRPTIAITGLSAGSAINVISGEAAAHLDCRLLPSDDPLQFVARLKDVGGDPSLRFEVLSQGRSLWSSTDTDFFAAIARARDRFDAGVPLLTPPATSSTDAPSLRALGMSVYGFEPFRLADEDDHSHGDDERLSLANLRLGIEVTHAIVLDVAAANAATSGHKQRG